MSRCWISNAGISNINHAGIQDPKPGKVKLTELLRAVNIQLRLGLNDFAQCYRVLQRFYSLILSIILRTAHANEHLISQENKRTGRKADRSVCHRCHLPKFYIIFL